LIVATNRETLAAVLPQTAKPKSVPTKYAWNSRRLWSFSSTAVVSPPQRPPQPPPRTPPPPPGVFLFCAPGLPPPHPAPPPHPPRRELHAASAWSSARRTSASLRPLRAGTWKE